jgi:nucleoside-diphosphate-sugar epimerase
VSAPGDTVLVTGAGGFLGTTLVRRLVADGARVRVLVRSPSRGEALQRAGVAEVVLGDITDPEAVGAAVRGAAIVHHLAGRLLAPVVPRWEYHRTHVEGTQVLLAACRGAAGRSPVIPRTPVVLQCTRR